MGLATVVWRGRLIAQGSLLQNILQRAAVVGVVAILQCRDQIDLVVLQGKHLVVFALQHVFPLPFDLCLHWLPMLALFSSVSARILERACVLLVARFVVEDAATSVVFLPGDVGDRAR